MERQSTSACGRKLFRSWGIHHSHRRKAICSHFVSGLIDDTPESIVLLETLNHNADKILHDLAETARLFRARFHLAINHRLEGGAGDTVQAQKFWNYPFWINDIIDVHDLV